MHVKTTSKLFMLLSVLQGSQDKCVNKWQLNVQRPIFPILYNVGHNHVTHLDSFVASIIVSDIFHIVVVGGWRGHGTKQGACIKIARAWWCWCCLYRPKVSELMSYSLQLSIQDTWWPFVERVHFSSIYGINIDSWPHDAWQLSITNFTVPENWTWWYNIF